STHTEGEAGRPPAREPGGHLQIEVRRLDVRTAAGGETAGVPGDSDGLVPLHVSVEVANFYPAIAFALSRRIYNLTQSRIHVLVTHAFLRSLARGLRGDGTPRLATSRTGRLRASGPRAVPSPRPREPRDRDPEP
ncbi:MAG: hypothetical protein KGJ43_08065, partial [Acidobacteriota bacterium]|nr:hypothetical protein [Acidobacteriota bacterium]